jgi:hypothetical protein
VVRASRLHAFAAWTAPVSAGETPAPQKRSSLPCHPRIDVVFFGREFAKSIPWQYTPTLQSRSSRPQGVIRFGLRPCLRKQTMEIAGHA